jgi:L-alanine-DL-glutamate epimerase-like enolase superfamily enzyme
VADRDDDGDAADPAEAADPAAADPGDAADPGQGTDPVVATLPDDLAIRSVRTIAVSVPLDTQVRWATRAVTAREFVLVFIEAGEHTGVGYTYAGMHTARSMAAYIDDVIAPRLVSLSARAPSRPWPDLFQETLLVGRRGFALRAISAVDIALWDLFGKIADQPVYRLLGGVRDTVEAYASGGYYRPGDPLERIDSEIGRYLDLGFTDVKIKVGGLGAHEDAERVGRVRELIGRDGRVALDANNAWKTAAEAIRFIRMVEEFDPWWIEEPLMPDDISGHAAIAAAVDVPVATGEIHSSRWDFRRLIEEGAADILQPDVAVIGGVSEWLKVAHAAAVFDLPVAPHWNQEVHVHMSAAVANCLTVEWFDIEQDIVNFERLLAERLHPIGGRIAVPDRPGMGLVFDDAAIERYAIGRATS